MSNIRDKLFELVDANKLVFHDINEALVKIDGRTCLPSWLEKEFNRGIETISADTLQGVKVALRFVNRKIEQIIKENS